jgi:hypothetical protein
MICQYGSQNNQLLALYWQQLWKARNDLTNSHPVFKESIILKPTPSCPHFGADRCDGHCDHYVDDHEVRGLVLRAECHGRVCGFLVTLNKKDAEKALKLHKNGIIETDSLLQ